MAAERGLRDVTFASAGTGAVNGSGASDGSVLIGVEEGLDLSTHRARQLTPAIVEPDTIILALASSHLDAIDAIVPNARVYLLDAYASRDQHQQSVSDPFGGPLEEYREAATQIEGMLHGVLDRLASERASRS